MRGLRTNRRTRCDLLPGAVLVSRLRWLALRLLWPLVAFVGQAIDIEEDES